MNEEKKKRAASRGYWIFRTKGADGKPHPRWRFRYRGADGKAKYGTGYPDKGETERLARRMAIEADEIRRGIRKAPDAADRESQQPVGEHLEAYLAWGKTQGGRGGRPWAALHSQNTERWLRWWIETLKIETTRDVTLPAVEKALQADAARGAAGKTLSNKAGVLTAFLHWAIERKLLSSYPLDGLRDFDTSVRPENVKRPFTLEEVGKLLAVALHPRPLIYKLALMTGFRASEIASLRTGDLDSEHATIRLRADYAKDRREAVAPLPRELADALTRHVRGLSPEAAIFPDFKPKEAAWEIRRDMDAAGIPRRTFGGKGCFHSLRVSMVNYAIETADAKTAQTLARHKTIDLTMNVYGRANAERVRAATEALGKAIEGAEAARDSRRGVERGARALAAGAENRAQVAEPERVVPLTGDGWGARIRT